MNSKKYRVISNTTPLIALSSINKLELLHLLYGEINIAEAVKDEINAGGTIEVDNPEFIDWIKIHDNIYDIREKLLFELDEGEKQTILVALDYQNDPLLLIDERKGRKIASNLGLKIKGTLGILADAKKRGMIDSFKKYAEMLIQNNLYYDRRLIEEISQKVD